MRRASPRSLCALLFAWPHLPRRAAVTEPVAASRMRRRVPPAADGGPVGQVRAAPPGKAASSPEIQAIMVKLNKGPTCAGHRHR